MVYKVMTRSPTGRTARPAQVTPPNRTGLPDDLKSGIEGLSGMSMDAVRVHFSSSKPAQMRALALAQGHEIHLAPGQERSLPHEAWHVVQQAQGRVAPTSRAGGVSINDDPALEREADRMGARATPTAGRSHHDSAPFAAPVKMAAMPVQRKINFSTFGDHHYLNEIYEKIRSAFERDREVLEKYLGTGEEQQAQGNKFKQLEEEVMNNTSLTTLIVRLRLSAIDFGEVNLDNPQHTIRLFLDFSKYLGADYIKKPEAETDAEAQRDGRTEAWEKAKQALVSSDGDTAGRAYQVALLGSGASIAYYLAANGRELDPKTTILIGLPQPWSPYGEGRRAIGYINHPMHMISPLRTKAGISDRETFDDNDAKLSRQIDQVIDRYVPYGHQVREKVESVTRSTKAEGWYEIKTDKGKVFYARKVISGFGIGPHARPQNSADPTKETYKEEDKGRVMDMDAYHRALQNPYSLINRLSKTKTLVVGISGPNAGVDAVKSATDRGFHVRWFVSGNHPAIVEGMANKIAKESNGQVTVYYRRLAGWSYLEDGQLQLIGDKQDRRPKDALPHDFGVADTVSPPPVDFLIYAQGPDVNQVTKPFESFKNELRAQAEEEGASKRFDAPTVYNFPRHDIKDSAVNIDTSIWNYIKVVAGEKNAVELDPGEVFVKLLRETHKILGMYTFALPSTKDVSEKMPPALGLTTEDGSLQIIGGHAHRLRATLKGETDEKDRTIDKRRLVSETLPPTDIIDDQLTPIRSQMEAMGNYMPAYIGTDEVNLTTDDQDMIAAQLAGYYANIPTELANWITQTIIRERRSGPHRVRPGTGQGGQAFNTRWTDKLEQLQKLFAPDNVISL
jgi:Domain of unknown function (DUF4157)